MIRTIPIVLLSMLSAGALTFCAPQPAHAQPANSAAGQYINCAQVAADVSLAARAMQLGSDGLVAQWASQDSDWYTRVVVTHAWRALASKNPTQYVRNLNKACLLETA